MCGVGAEETRRTPIFQLNILSSSWILGIHVFICIFSLSISRSLFFPSLLFPLFPFPVLWLLHTGPFPFPFPAQPRHHQFNPKRLTPNPEDFHTQPLIPSSRRHKNSFLLPPLLLPPFFHHTPADTLFFVCYLFLLVSGMSKKIPHLHTLLWPILAASEKSSASVSTVHPYPLDSYQFYWPVSKIKKKILHQLFIADHLPSPPSRQDRTLISTISIPSFGLSAS